MSPCLVLFRMGQALARWRVPLMPSVLDRVNRVLFGCWLPHSVGAGRNFVVGYWGMGVVVHADAVLGDDVHLDQQVTIGGDGVRYGVPRIGDRVYVGAGARLLGPIVVGDDCVVGANAVVVRDVPSGSVVVGVPGRVVKTGIVLREYLYHLRTRNRS